MTDIRQLIQEETGAPSINEGDHLSELGLDSLDLTQRETPPNGPSIHAICNLAESTNPLEIHPPSHKP